MGSETSKTKTTYEKNDDLTSAQQGTATHAVIGKVMTNWKCLCYEVLFKWLLPTKGGSIIKKTIFVYGHKLNKSEF